MRQIKSLIITALTISNSAFGQMTKCECEGDYKEIIKYSDKFVKIKVCGTQTKNDSLVYELTIFDCIRDTFLLDNRGDQIFPNHIKLTKNGFKITSYQFAPIGNNWTASIFPFTETEYTYENKNKLTSIEKNVFSYPDLTTKQIDSIKVICDILNANKSDKVVPYPLDYETIYILAVGAYKDIYVSRQLFKNLSNFFELDGAASETLGEIIFPSLFEIKKN